MTPAEQGKEYLKTVLYHQVDIILSILNDALQETIEKAVLEEREACAKLLWNENSNHRRDCNTWYGHQPCDCPEYNYAQAIRARGEK